jgi:hypothetical protein
VIKGGGGVFTDKYAPYPARAGDGNTDQYQLWIKKIRQIKKSKKVKEKVKRKDKGEKIEVKLKKLKLVGKINANENK